MGRVYPRKPETHFSILPQDVIRNRSIGHMAFRILAYGLGMPDDWTHTLPSLERELGIAKKTARTAIKDLEGLGYAVSVEWRGERGRFHRDIVFCYPAVSPEDAEAIRADIRKAKDSPRVPDGVPANGIPSTGYPSRTPRQRDPVRGTPLSNGGPSNGPSNAVKEGAPVRGPRPAHAGPRPYDRDQGNRERWAEYIEESKR